MKKTAIQELINEINQEVSKLEPNQYSWHCLMSIIEMAESKLEKEKEDLIEAFGDGINHYRLDFCNRNDYFDKTFKNK